MPTKKQDLLKVYNHWIHRPESLLIIETVPVNQNNFNSAILSDCDTDHDIINDTGNVELV